MGNYLKKCLNPQTTSPTRLPGKNPPADLTRLPKKNPPTASSARLPEKNRPAASSTSTLPEKNRPAASSTSTLPEKNTPAASSSTSELQKCIGLFKDGGDIDELIHIIHQLLQREKSKQQNIHENASTSSQVTHERKEESSMWTSITNSGSKFLSYLNNLGSSKRLHDGIKVAAELLQQAGQTQSIVGGLSTIAYVLVKFEKSREIRPECLQMLGDMIDLARHLRSLKDMIPEEKEKFMKAIELIVEGSITCLGQLESNMLFRFIKSSVNSENLSNLRKRINELYPNLLMTAMLDMRKDIPSYLPITKPIYPQGAVGIEKQVDKVMNLFEATDQSSIAVVIYGFGGMGKTTVAEAVASKMDFSNYNYTRVEMYQDEEKNDFKSSQQQILKDCFPDYNGGIPIQLRDCKDGQDKLMEAFKCKKNKAIFLFIDNALWSLDLKALLPKDLGGLPQGSKILITTRLLGATDMFEGKPNLVRRPYCLQALPDEDASEILFKNQTKRTTVKNEDLKRILKICSGVPLVLKIVGAQLHKQSYRVDRCANMLENLEKGVTVKDEKLSECLVDFVYNGLEKYCQEAFLDICCFFSKWNRQDVEYVVGATAVTALLEAGLITSTSEHNDPNAVFPFWEELFVHNIIVAKGRSLAYGNRIMDILSLSEAADEERLNEVKGVWLTEDMSEHVIEEKHLSSMRKSLRVLALGDQIKVSRVSQKKFEELRFLGVSGYIRELPVKLEVLDKLTVFHGPFFVGGEVSLHKLPKNLLAMKVMAMKVMEQSNDTECTNSQVTGTPQCSFLEKLDFSELWELPQLPEGFNQLERLEILILDGCYQMRELPEQICQLPALKILIMRYCWCLKCLPQSFGQLTTLTHLDLSDCRELKTLPSTFGQLTALRDLNLSGCDIQALPSNFTQLVSLQHLECHPELKKLVEPQISSEVLINSGFFNIRKKFDTKKSSKS